MSIELIMQIINYVMLAIILICGLIGFKRGTLKSGYYIVATFIALLLGLLLMKPISKAMLEINISWLNINIDGVQVSTPMQFITDFITLKYPDYTFLLQENSYSIELLKGVASIATKVIYFIVLLLSLVTVFYLIFGILWKIFKPQLRSIFNKKQENDEQYEVKKYRVSMLSRLGGLGIGLTKGLIYLLLIGIIFAGVSSIATSLDNITSNTNKEVGIVLVEDTFTIMELGSDTNELIDNSSLFDDETRQILQAYRKSISGKVFGTLKFGESKSTFDEILFDSIFTIDGKNGNIKIRKELIKLNNLLENEAIKTVMTDGFDFNKLYLLSEDDLKQIVDVLSSLDCVKVIVPVGLELITYSDLLKDKLGTEYDSVKELLEKELPELLKMNYCNEIKNLGYVFIDVLDLLGDGLEDPGKIDYFNFDQDIINQIFTNLEKLEIFDIVAPIAINYLINSETVIKAIEKVGFTIEDLGLNNEIDYSEELKNLPKLYEKFIALGVKQVEGKIDFSSLNNEAINDFVEALFDSTIISNALPVVASTLTTSYLPEEYSDIFTKEELDAIDWKKEFSPLLSAVATLLNTDILTAEDKIAALSSLSFEDIEILGTNLAQSELISSKLNIIMDKLLKTLLSDKVTYQGLDNENEKWDKNEIISLFNVMKQFTNGFNLQFTEEEINDLTLSMSSSKYIKKNLNSIVNALTESFGFEVASLTEEEWTMSEIYITFKALNVVTSSSVGNDISLEDFLNLSEEQQNILLESKIIKNSLKRLLIEKTKQGQELDILKGVYENGINEQGKIVYSWDDEIVDAAFEIKGNKIIFHQDNTELYIIYKNDLYFASTTNTEYELDNLSNSNDYSVKAINKKGELRNIINAISKLEINNVNDFNIDLKVVITNKETLFASYIFQETMINEIRKLQSQKSQIICIPSEYNENGNGQWSGKNGELYNLLDAIDALLDISKSDEKCSIESLNQKLEFLLLNKISDNLDVVLKSDIISATIINKLRNLNNNGLTISDEFMIDDSLWFSIYNDGKLVEHQELGNIINSLALITKGQNDRIEALNVQKAIDSALQLFKDDENIETVLKSKILAATIKEYITSSQSFSNSNYINDAFKNNNKNVNNIDEWYSYDENNKPLKKELWKLLQSVALILDGQSFTELEHFNIELIINNKDMLPTLNEQYNVTKSNIDVMLNSIIIEEIFASIVKDICVNGGYLSSVINIPSDVNWYHKDVIGNEEYDLKTFLESFLLVQSFFGYGENSDIINSITKLKSLSNDEVELLATGMVISRIFRGSIEKIFNTIFGTEYLIKSLTSTNMKPWDSIKFNQKDYEGNTKIQARTKFIQTFNTICYELNK